MTARRQYFSKEGRRFFPEMFNATGGAALGAVLVGTLGNLSGVEVFQIWATATVIVLIGLNLVHLAVLLQHKKEKPNVLSLVGAGKPASLTGEIVLRFVVEHETHSLALMQQAFSVATPQEGDVVVPGLYHSRILWTHEIVPVQGIEE